MQATRKQRILRGGVLIVVGLGGVLAISLDPGRAARDPRTWAWLIPMLAWTVWENAILRADEPKSYVGKLGTRLAQLCIIAASLAGTWEAMVWRGVAPPPAAFWIGGAFVIASGAALRIWAIRTLSDHFRYELRVDEGQSLVRSGPYAVLRHPSYTGLVLIGGGIALVFSSNLAALIGAALLFLILALRAHGEERILEQAFGPHYDAYRRTTWRLVPFVY